MKKLMSKSVILAVMMFGAFFVANTADANAQTRCRTRGYDSRVYDDRGYNQGGYYPTSNGYYNDDYYGQQRRNRRYNDDYYEDREDTRGRAIGRTAAGAGIGAVGGAVVGGKKGAVIGAGIGAVGGYLYHRNKVNNQRNRW